MKLRSTRGEYCVAVSDNATMVMEKTTPATVIIDVAMADSIAREPLALAPNRRGDHSASSRVFHPSNSTRASAAAIEASTTSPGTNQKLARTACQLIERRLMRA